MMKPKYNSIAILIASIAIIFTSCGESGPNWQLEKTIDIKGIAPIGFDIEDNHFWISDGDNNRLIQTSMDGVITKEETEFERPMHLAIDNGNVFVPSYGSDAIIKYKNGIRDTVSIQDSLDAPAGVDVVGNEIAIADFYNHRILYSDGANWMKVGEKGNGDLEFHYPTDVQLAGDKIYIADAYNNRIQIIDKTGKHVKNIGKDQKMNAATGIYVDNNQIYITDFEHDRVLLFNEEGDLLSEIKEGLEKPTDILVHEEKLYIINYKSQSIAVFKK